MAIPKTQSGAQVKPNQSVIGWGAAGQQIEGKPVSQANPFTAYPLGATAINQPYADALKQPIKLSSGPSSGTAPIYPGMGGVDTSGLPAMSNGPQNIGAGLVPAAPYSTPGNVGGLPMDASNPSVYANAAAANSPFRPYVAPAQEVNLQRAPAAAQYSLAPLTAAGNAAIQAIYQGLLGRLQGYNQQARGDYNTLQGQIGGIYSKAAADTAAQHAQAVGNVQDYANKLGMAQALAGSIPMQNWEAQAQRMAGTQNAVGAARQATAAQLGDMFNNIGNMRLGMADTAGAGAQAGNIAKMGAAEAAGNLALQRDVMQFNQRQAQLELQRQMYNARVQAALERQLATEQRYGLTGQPSTTSTNTVSGVNPAEAAAIGASPELQASVLNSNPTTKGVLTQIQNLPQQLFRTSQANAAVTDKAGNQGINPIATMTGFLSGLGPAISQAAQMQQAANQWAIAKGLYGTGTASQTNTTTGKTRAT